jgi:hypothetical protein
MNLLSFFKKPRVQSTIEPDPRAFQEELNVIRVFALGNTKLRESAIRIGRKYIHLAFQHPNCFPELQFMREVDNPCPDLAMRAHWRQKIKDKK